MAQRLPLYHINRHRIEHISQLLIQSSPPERTLIFEKAYKALTGTEKKMILEWLVRDFQLVIHRRSDSQSRASEKADDEMFREYNKMLLEDLLGNA